MTIRGHLTFLLITLIALPGAAQQTTIEQRVQQLEKRLDALSQQVTEVRAQLDPAGHAVVDATGLLVLPGGVDAHTHGRALQVDHVLLTVPHLGRDPARVQVAMDALERARRGGAIPRAEGPIGGPALIPPCAEPRGGLVP